MGNLKPCISLSWYHLRHNLQIATTADCGFVKQLQKGISGARSDDTKGLKGAILDWIVLHGQSLHPVIASHLHIFGCSAYVTINKKKRRKLNLKSQEMTFIGYEQGSKGYQFWDKDGRSIVISHDVKFDESKFPHRKDLDYKNPFADEKRQSISVKNWRKTTDESDTDTEEGLVIPSMSDSDDDHRPSCPAPPPPGAPPPVPPKTSPGLKNTKEKKQKTPRPDEELSTTISLEPDT